ncbi:putative phosphonate C-P lyase system protein PhnK [Acetobacteraceae bacterium AT-5844]|nr:putative phosphonate C-P lyase system protein PhnK [Acetobacteraceae bacterium AT-5844]
MSDALLSVRDLSVEFRTRSGIVPALRGVSFEVAPGEMLGIVGESGSGKSVTAYSVLGLLEASARVTGGQAIFGGRDVLRLGQAALNELRGAEMSIVFQNPRTALNPIRPVGAQIADVIARHDPAPPAVIRERVLEALRQMRIAEPERRASAYPFELSGGMCQRIGIAMALACAPRLLIADEPTTGLDVTTQAAVMDLFRDAVRARGVGSILITHDLALASQYCDRIVVMQTGKVVEDAPVSEIFARPRHPYTQRLLRSTPSSVDRIEDLVPEEEPVAPAPPRAPTSGPPVLEVRGLRKSYALSRPGLFWWRRNTERLQAVGGVGLAIQPGEAVGLVGESGCGKSTLSRMICRLIQPDEGEVLLDGEPIHRIAPGRFARMPQRRQIQMVFQDPTESLNPRFSVFDAIADPVKQLMPREGTALLRQRVERAAAQVGLPLALLPRYPHQLSGGQKARVGIARAMAVEPRLLVLDEPTSALDVSVQAVVLKLLTRLRRQEGVAQLFVSHDLNVVRLLCDRILVMHKGQVVESGPAEQVFNNPAHDYTRSLLAAIPRLPMPQEAGTL